MFLYAILRQKNKNQIILLATFLANICILCYNMQLEKRGFMDSRVDTAKIQKIVERKYSTLSMEEEYLNEIKDEIIEEFLKLENSIGYQNPYADFALYTYLMKNGYFHYQLSKKREYLLNANSGLMSVGALNNHGVCRHKNALFAEILSQHYENAAVYIGSYQDDLENPIPHMITQIEWRDKTHYFDAEMGWCLEYNNSDCLKGPKEKYFVGNESDLRYFANYLIGLEPLPLKESLPLESTSRLVQHYRLELEKYKDYLLYFHERNQRLLREAERVYRKVA